MGGNLGRPRAGGGPHMATISVQAAGADESGGGRGRGREVVRVELQVDLSNDPRSPLSRQDSRGRGTTGTGSNHTDPTTCTDRGDLGGFCTAFCCRIWKPVKRKNSESPPAQYCAGGVTDAGQRCKVAEPDTLLRFKDSRRAFCGQGTEDRGRRGRVPAARSWLPSSRSWSGPAAPEESAKRESVKRRVREKKRQEMKSRGENTAARAPPAAKPQEPSRSRAPYSP